MGSFEKMREVMNEFNFKFVLMQRRYRAELRVLLAKSGIQPGQPHVLVAIGAKEACTQAELCKMIGIKPASMTVLLQRMEKSNLIERGTDENDMRKLCVKLTQKGSDALNEISGISAELERVCFIGFSKKEKIEFLKLSERVSENLARECVKISSNGEGEVIK